MWKTNLKVLVVALVVIGFYTTVAHVIPQLQSEVPETLDLTSNASPEALVAAGERVYNGAGGCTACHGLGTRAPNLLTDQAGQGPIGVRCGKRKPGMDCKAYLYESLTNPSAFVVPGFEPIMPDMRRQLSNDQIWAAIAFLESQGGEVTVTADDIKKTATAGAGGNAGASAGAAGASAAGPAMTATLDPRQLVKEKGCIGCHTIEGAGAKIGPALDGVGSRRKPDDIRRKILNPASDTVKGFEKLAGVMPKTFGQQLSAAQLEALVQFLASRK
jgi:mono/diheme cytochrome c family protein